MATTRTKEREATRGRFGKQRSNALEDRLARIMRSAFAAGEIAYIGGLEAPLRHAIRAGLCLAGWRWIDAERAAQATVEGALCRAGAERPAWAEGQREWTIQGGTLIERTRCATCHKKLTGEQRKFCSRPCNNRWHARLVRLRETTEDAATWIAINSI